MPLERGHIDNLAAQIRNFYGSADALGSSNIMYTNPSTPAQNMPDIANNATQIVHTRFAQADHAVLVISDGRNQPNWGLSCSDFTERNSRGIWIIDPHKGVAGRAHEYADLYRRQFRRDEDAGLVEMHGRLTANNQGTPIPREWYTWGGLRQPLDEQGRDHSGLNIQIICTRAPSAGSDKSPQYW